ncbi:MAG TPA: flagellar basal body-associated FliL family protein [Rhizomicrobium sp.]|nr:flagellar basal body-associated FliL family protein [Rhizomicrobium sp.]
MAKDDAKTDVAEEEPAEGADSAAPKQGFVKKLLGNKKLLLIGGGGALVLLLGSGAGLYFFVFSGHGAQNKVAAAAAPVPIVPPQVAFYDVPDIVVNIQNADATPAYLKLSVALEIATADEKAGLQALMPRIVDQFQSYLRELRVDDLHGSAGVLRLKEELLRRVKVSAAPYPVRDVLLKEMIVQ